MSGKAFFAYPQTTGVLADAIAGAVELSESGAFRLYPWEAMRIIGFKVDDVVRGEIAESDVLVADITYPNPNVFYELGYEMRDVAGTPEDIFYHFIGESELLTDEELGTILRDDTLGMGVQRTTNLLLWYGFLGIVAPSGETIFIYDRAYDLRRLQAEMSNESSERLYAVNPAFLRGLRRI